MTNKYLPDLIDTYLTGHRPPLAENSVKSYRSSLRRFMKVNRLTTVDEITVELVDDWVFADGTARRSQAHRRSVLNNFCQWLVHQGLMDTNPVATAAKPRMPRTRPRALSPSAASAVMRAARRSSVEDALIVSLMLNEGLRSMEVRGLEVDDIDTERGTVHVHGKGDVERTLPLTGQTRGFLEQHLRQYGFRAGNVVLSRPTRRPMSSQAIYRRVVNLFVEAGVSTGSSSSAYASSTVMPSHFAMRARSLYGFAWPFSMRDNLVSCQPNRSHSSTCVMLSSRRLSTMARARAFIAQTPTPGGLQNPF